MSVSTLQNWQRDNVERKCNDAVREALSYGLNSREFQQMIAQAWHDVLTDEAERGRQQLQMS